MEASKIYSQDTKRGGIWEQKLECRFTLQARVVQTKLISAKLQRYNAENATSSDGNDGLACKITFCAIHNQEL